MFEKKVLGRILNCILMVCNLAKKGDVMFSLVFLNGTLLCVYICTSTHTQGIHYYFWHLHHDEQPCWFLILVSFICLKSCYTFINCTLNRLKSRPNESPYNALSWWFEVERFVTTWKAGLNIFPVSKESFSLSLYRDICRLANAY